MKPMTMDGSIEAPETRGAGGDAPGVLLVEDDPIYARLLLAALARALGSGRVDLVASVADAIAFLERVPASAIVLDRRLPDGDGLDVLRWARASGCEAPVVLLTGDGTAAGAVAALRAGAAEYVVKAADAPERLAELLRGYRASIVRGDVSSRGATRLIGESVSLRRLRSSVRRFASSAACVLVGGETGVGKELVARALHEESPRAGAAFVAVNCGALPEQLAESELFGHLRGAFTGAHRDHAGLVESAARGTLFLDEVEDLSPGLQGKLLRLLQESEYRPVGATRARMADVRVVAASNADLVAMVARREFRRDLYFRLDVLRIDVPPLRERREDLPGLIFHLLERRSRKGGERRPMGTAASACLPSPAVLARLAEHSWPGNVRELGNLVERVAVFAHSVGWTAAWEFGIAGLGNGGGVTEVLGSADRFPGDGTEKGSFRAAGRPEGEPSAPGCGDGEAGFLRRTLEQHRWRRDAAARALGISRVTLWRRMRRAGLVHEDATEVPAPGG